MVDIVEELKSVNKNLEALLWFVSWLVQPDRTSHTLQDTNVVRALIQGDIMYEGMGDIKENKDEE